MKHTLFILFTLIFLAVPVFAEESETIVLDDTTPSIDVVVTLPPDTTGGIHLDLAQSAVTLTDEMNNIVFYSADARVHGLELNIAPNTGSHTLTVERLPGAATASVNVSTLDNLAIKGTVVPTEGNSIALNQAVNLIFEPAQPGESVTISIPEETRGVVTATFPQMNTTTQIVDIEGTVVMATYNGHVDGFNAVLDTGLYELIILTDGTNNEQAAGIRVVSAEEADFPIIEAPAVSDEVVQTGTCNAQVAVSSVNFRSGPGTGYSVIDYGYYDEQYLVGGRNPENNWVVIATDDGSAWVSASTLNFADNCEDLIVHNIPFRDAPVASVIMATAQPAQAVIVQPAQQQPEIVYVYEDEPSSNNRDHDDDDHDDDHDEDEDEEHDDDD